jgi:hypothetical protein
MTASLGNFIASLFAGAFIALTIGLSLYQSK